MSTSSLTSLTAADAVLWTALEPGVRSLPAPIPAGLCELPLARLSRYDPKPDPQTGRLAEEEWLHLHRVRALTGQWFGVRIAGDPQLGLPRAGDWPVLMAVLRLFEDAGWRSNTLGDVSIRRVLATMGVTGGGKMVRRVREALLRFAQVRVLIVPIAASVNPADVLAQLPDAVDDLAAGGQRTSAMIPAIWNPVPVRGQGGRGRRRGPDGSGEGAGEREAPAAGIATGILDVAWRDDTIERITVAEAWRPRAGTTPTSWIDYGRYFSLGDPVAQRLYQLLAGAVGRGEAAPHEQSLEWLQSALGLSPRFKRSRVREYVSAAITELRAAEILGDATFDGAGPHERLIAMPGPVLEVARLFAGIGVEVPKDVRLQLAMLQRLGVHRAEAERLLSADPAQTYEVLCYVLYALRHEPDAIRDPGPYIRKAITEGYRFAKPAYQSWRAGLQRKSLELFRARESRPVAPAAEQATHVAHRTPRVQAAAPEPGASAPTAPAAPALVIDGADADAGALWGAVADELRRRAEPRQLRLLWITTQLHQVAGARLVGDTLVCATPDLALRAWMSAEPGRALLAEVVSALTDGSVTQVAARVPGDVDRAVVGPEAEEAPPGD